MLLLLLFFLFFFCVVNDDTSEPDVTCILIAKRLEKDPLQQQSERMGEVQYRTII